MPVRHAPHLCYNCGCTILRDQEETRVTGLKQETTIRYKHAAEDGCRAALDRQIGYGTVYGRDPGDDAESMYQGRN